MKNIYPYVKAYYYALEIMAVERGEHVRVSERSYMQGYHKNQRNTTPIHKERHIKQCLQVVRRHSHRGLHESILALHLMFETQ